MTIKELIKEYPQNFTGSSQKMWDTIDIVSEAMEYVETSKPELYWETIKAIYRVLCGGHYNQKFAEWQVNKMFHIGTDGKEYKGAHWTKSQVDEVIAAHRNEIPKSYTDWDVYVALNASYHDLCKTKKKRYPDTYENEIILDAISFWFNDDDMKEDKVWDYFNR